MAAPTADNGASGCVRAVPADSPRGEVGVLVKSAAAIQEKLDAAICQIAILNQRISDLERRHNRALENKKHALCHSYRMQLNIAQDEKKRYNHYACLRAAELGQAKEQIEEARARASASGHPSGGPGLD
ncbi:hypothetical protein HPB48_020126 [Haemaphysalis longicornis]|uniref:Uncharacterized protein n=1 Tax=Haemaphysalis longicornis TaxID=44386 RepID=A0A9J6FDZ5_HAELO|nr:hypothetical protein HPB48_020126 [Haemaphysalis longicornis]